MEDTLVSRRCSYCGTEYARELIESAFRLDISCLKRRFICVPCEQTRRDQKKKQDRWLVKARDIVRRHAVTLKLTKRKLIDDYGWSISRLAHDAHFQYGGNCTYCEKPYEQMGHGLYDISIDVVDRSRLPYYGTNTRWCCQTCNREKGTLNPESFERRKRVWAQWQKFGGKPQQSALVFDNLGDTPK